MEISKTDARRRGALWGRIITGMMVACLLSVPGTYVSAQTEVTYQPDPMVVRNDRGGRLLARLRQIGELRQSRRPVEISGRVCYSTCTMFLGLPQTCISPQTTFGFHGPTSYGRSLDQATFDHASAVIASHYPPALKSWYMEKGRFETRGVYKISGRQLIAMGISVC